jgi:protein SMG7
MLINNHILFRDEIVDGSLSRSHSQATGLSEHSIPSVPLHQQQLLADIRDARLDVQLDDDNMTEGTDVLREAFDFLHADQPEDDDQDDEIVWDPRSLILSDDF